MDKHDTQQELDESENTEPTSALETEQSSDDQSDKTGNKIVACLQTNKKIVMVAVGVLLLALIAFLASSSSESTDTDNNAAQQAESIAEVDEATVKSDDDLESLIKEVEEANEDPSSLDAIESFVE